MMVKLKEIEPLIELKKILPNENFIYYGDSENAPYGTRTTEEILETFQKVCENSVYSYKKQIC